MARWHNPYDDRRYPHTLQLALGVLIFAMIVAAAAVWALHAALP